MRALEGVLCQGLMARLGICRVQSEADRVMVLKSSCGTRAGGDVFVVLQLLFSPALQCQCNTGFVASTTP